MLEATSSVESFRNMLDFKTTQFRLLSAKPGPVSQWCVNSSVDSLYAVVSCTVCEQHAKASKKIKQDDDFIKLF